MCDCIVGVQLDGTAVLQVAGFPVKLCPCHNGACPVSVGQCTVQLERSQRRAIARGAASLGGTYPVKFRLFQTPAIPACAGA